MFSSVYNIVLKKNAKQYVHTTLSGTPGGGNERFLGGGERR